MVRSCPAVVMALPVVALPMVFLSNPSRVQGLGFRI